MAHRYGERTSVPIERSQAELKKLVLGQGATTYLSFEDAGRWCVQFFLDGRLIRLVVPKPNPNDEKVLIVQLGKWRTPAQQAVKLDQLGRQCWRALLLIVKAKFEVMSSGISTLEQEFLAHLVLPGGQCIGEWAAPQLAQMYANGQSPASLPLPGGSEASHGG
jgi:hypothetical protein